MKIYVSLCNRYSLGFMILIKVFYNLKDNNPGRIQCSRNLLALLQVIVVDICSHKNFLCKCQGNKIANFRTLSLLTLRFWLGEIDIRMTIDRFSWLYSQVMWYFRSNESFMISLDSIILSYSKIGIHYLSWLENRYTIQENRFT